MNAAQAERVVRRVAGFWPTPAMTDEEALGWAEVLTSDALAITSDEALAFLRRRVHDGSAHRPRPGELVAFVRSERRWQRMHDDTKALAAPRDGVCDGERSRAWIRVCRRVAGGETLEAARAAEGVG